MQQRRSRCNATHLMRENRTAGRSACEDLLQIGREAGHVRPKDMTLREHRPACITSAVRRRYRTTRNIGQTKSHCPVLIRPTPRTDQHNIGQREASI